jgi:hypothetical protein
LVRSSGLEIRGESVDKSSLIWNKVKETKNVRAKNTSKDT